nr:hypothetical protein GCM10020093_045680 [Planobispora longispora]
MLSIQSAGRWMDQPPSSETYGPSSGLATMGPGSLGSGVGEGAGASFFFSDFPAFLRPVGEASGSAGAVVAPSAVVFSEPRVAHTAVPAPARSTTTSATISATGLRLGCRGGGGSGRPGPCPG